MNIYYKSTGPAGFGEYTEIRKTMLELIKNDGGYAYHFGCTRVTNIGRFTIHKYFKPKTVQRYIKIFEGGKL